MKKQKQAITDFKNGDCFRTCVANLLDIKRDKIPNFMKDGEDFFRENVTSFNHENDFILLDIEVKDEKLIKDMLCIAIGISPRNRKFHHSVIWKNGECVFDPHPDNKGIVGKPVFYTLLIPKSPEILKKLIKI